MKLIPHKKDILLCLIAFVFGGLSTLVLVATQGLSFGPEGFPLDPEAARMDAERIARLTSFPKQTSELSMTSRGGPFGGQFQVAFFGDIDEVSAWVNSCPGIQDPSCKSHQTEDGGIRYEIPQRPVISGSSVELLHNPIRGTVVVILSN